MMGSETAQEQKTKQIEFTGNWFIDAGILGFVNLMEEVYGWDLETLREKIAENEELVYYGYFPFAYLFYNSRFRAIRGEINTLRKKITDKNNGLVVKLNTEKKKLRELLSDENTSNKNTEKKAQKSQEKIDGIQVQIEELNKTITEHERKLKSEKSHLEDNLNHSIPKILKDAPNYFVNVKHLIESIIPIFDPKKPFDHVNFFFYNPKKSIYISFAYLFFLLKKDQNNVTLIRATKHDETMLKVTSFCLSHKINPIQLIQTVKEDFQEGLKQGKVVENITRRCDNSCKEDHKPLMEDFVKSLKEEIENPYSYEEMPDSTINPFLHASGKFPNINYTPPLTVAQLDEVLPVSIPVYARLLSFSHAFQNIQRRFINTYSNSLEHTYNLQNKIKESFRSVNKGNLLSVTIKSAIDNLVERKSLQSVRDLYVLEFSRISNQKLLGVEYLNISKLNATILLDDVIRSNINKSLRCSKNRDNEYVWVLEELLSEKPLLPLCLEHIIRVVKDNVYFSMNSVLYAALIDANKQKMSNKERHFRSDFFKPYPDLVADIKKDVNYTSFVASMLAIQFNGKEHKQKLLELITAIKGNDKSHFLDIIFRFLNTADQSTREKVSGYVSKNITQNESWQPYGLALTLQVVKKCS